jgi:ATP synthase protein I
MTQTPGREPNDPAGKTTDAAFVARLDAARRRHGLDKPPQPADGVDAAAPSGLPWGVGLRAGVEMLSAMVVGLAVGYGLDRWLHTLPLFLVVFVLLGGAAGVLNVWRVFAPPGSKLPGLWRNR